METADVVAGIDRFGNLALHLEPDQERFQKRRNLFKYLGGLKEFPANLKKQIGKQKRKELIATLTTIYREEAQLYPGIARDPGTFGTPDPANPAKLG